jgi:hypothetical protein
MFNLLRRDYFLTWLRVLLNDFLYCICYNGCFHGSMRICYMFVIVNSFMYKHDKGVPWVYVLCLEVICHIIFTAVGRVWIKWGKGGEFRQILKFIFFNLLSIGCTCRFKSEAFASIALRPWYWYLFIFKHIK